MHSSFKCWCELFHSFSPSLIHSIYSIHQLKVDEWTKRLKQRKSLKGYCCESVFGDMCVYVLYSSERERVQQDFLVSSYQLLLQGFCLKCTLTFHYLNAVFFLPIHYIFMKFWFEFHFFFLLWILQGKNLLCILNLAHCIIECFFPSKFTNSTMYERQIEMDRVKEKEIPLLPRDCNYFNTVKNALSGNLKCALCGEC